MVKELSYDFPAKHGVLRMEEDNACDMNGCIALFRRIDPAVETIQTIAGEVDDTAYRLVGKGWVATAPSRG
ncbi:hypothetical protein HJC02_17860 [Rhizobium sp. NLR4a]|uniref:hypothetical protein n=1 Tax=Rhizobium sp. NLR4a TaxID=2731117 RepID=UPI001C8338D0|nr:hypothetical protein [Rhizobium sp. NLR4a]MBX5234109.1 hypothetical protein [Rhizobium sp. NLR4a]